MEETTILIIYRENNGSPEELLCVCYPVKKKQSTMYSPISCRRFHDEHEKKKNLTDIEILQNLRMIHVRFNQKNHSWPILALRRTIDDVFISFV